MTAIKDSLSISTNDLQPSSSMARAKVDKRDPKMLEAAQSFENQFIRQMISEMRKTVPKDGLIDESMADGIYKEQLDNEYANQWVNQGGIGLADLIYDQLQERYGPGANHGPATKSGTMIPLPQKPVGALQSKGAAGEVGDLLSPADQKDFIGKRLDEGFLMKARVPLKKEVQLQAPFSGVVLQAGALDDGRKLLVLKHDKGLVSQIVHPGQSLVSTGQTFQRGDAIARLPAAADGRIAKVFFGLRKASNAE